MTYSIQNTMCTMWMCNCACIVLCSILDYTDYTILSVTITEHTQSGNGRFLAYIPSWWKNSPCWWGWGADAHPLSLYPPLHTKLQCPLQLECAAADILSLFHLYPYELCEVRYIFSWNLLCLCYLRVWFHLYFISESQYWLTVAFGCAFNLAYH